MLKPSNHTVGIASFRSNMTGFIEKAKLGDTVTITSNGLPVAQLIPPQTSSRVMPFGALIGRIQILDDSDSLPAEIIEAFYESEL